MNTKICIAGLNRRAGYATDHEVICLLYEYKDEYRDTKYLIY